MKKAVIIAAGGKGLRMNSDIPKQFLITNNKPILFYTIEAFFKFDKEIFLVLALPEDYVNYWFKLIKDFSFEIPHKVVLGGETRYHSVKNALNFVDNFELIAVHDAVRPFITTDFLQKLFTTAQEKGSAIPILRASDTIREINKSQNKILNREHIFMVQTPQVFLKDWLFKAYDIAYSQEVTDDAILIEKAGYKLTFVEGLKYNIKITTPEDLFVVNCLSILYSKQYV
jgi:2-C-methyl-D-erythritol 4-phosphate cytidylyltransferase